MPDTDVQVEQEPCPEWCDGCTPQSEGGGGHFGEPEVVHSEPEAVVNLAAWLEQTTAEPLTDAEEVPA
jgi:hypothetical protein